MILAKKVIIFLNPNEVDISNVEIKAEEEF
jgi:hypothetical protein